MSLAAFGQNALKAEKFDEFGLVYCCELGARVDFASITRIENPGSKIHVIFYSGRKHEGWKFDRKTGKKSRRSSIPSDMNTGPFLQNS